MSDPKTTSPRRSRSVPDIFKHRPTPLIAVGLTIPATGCNPVMAIQQCIDAISALDSVYAAALRREERKRVTDRACAMHEGS